MRLDVGFHRYGGPDGPDEAGRHKCARILAGIIADGRAAGHSGLCCRHSSSQAALHRKSGSHRRRSYPRPASELMRVDDQRIVRRIQRRVVERFTGRNVDRGIVIVPRAAIIEYRLKSGHREGLAVVPVTTGDAESTTDPEPVELDVPVPPDATGIGPPVRLRFRTVAVPVDVIEGTVRGPVSVPPVIGTTPMNAALSCDAVSTCPGTNCARAAHEISSASAPTRK